MRALQKIVFFMFISLMCLQAHAGKNNHWNQQRPYVHKMADTPPTKAGGPENCSAPSKIEPQSPTIRYEKRHPEKQTSHFK